MTRSVQDKISKKGRDWATLLGNNKFSIEESPEIGQMPLQGIMSYIS